MKTKLICWLPESTYRNEDSKKLLIDNEITPLLDSSYATDIWLEQEGIDTLRTGDFVPIDDDVWRTDIECYIDEPLSTKHYKSNNDAGFKLLCEADNVTIGETCTEYIQQLVDAGCKSITFTSYGWHLFRIFGVNIRMPFTTQLNTWEKLDAAYNHKTQYINKYMGYGYIDTIPYPAEDLFTFCWIMLDQVKSFKKLIQWCKDHNKTIGLVAPDKYKDNPEWVKKHLQLFINVYKEVVK